MKTLIKSITLVAVFLVAERAVPQSPEPLHPRVIPMSPEARQMAKYIDYPMDYSTGLPQIEIPLYEIQDGDIRIPIKLTYHASGFRVNEVETWVGYGWTLHAEPTIARSIQGLPDEQSYLYGISPSVRSGPYYWKYLSDGQYDEDPDIFYYRLVDVSGKFIIKKEYGQPSRVITFPKEPLAISHAGPTSVASFVVRDNKGLTYSFGGSGFTETTNLGKITGWKASAITSAKTGQTVSFSYHAAQQFANGHVSPDRITVLDSAFWHGIQFQSNPLSSGGAPPLFQLPMPTVMVDQQGIRSYYRVDNTGQLIYYLGGSVPSPAGEDYQVSCRHIHEIQFSGGKVVFNKQSGILKSIEVLDPDGALKRRIELVQTKPAGNRLVLNEIKFTDGPAELKHYAFDYYGSPPVDFTSRAIDHWGYYNGAWNNAYVPLVPPTAVTGVEVAGTFRRVDFSIGSGNRDPNAIAAETGMLRSIIYPTGGKTTFTYNGHRYKDLQGNVHVAGGLRIREIKQEGGDGATLYRVFKYGTDEINETGHISYPVRTDNLLTSTIDMYCKPQFIGYFPDEFPNLYKWVEFSSVVPVRRRTYSSGSLVDLFGSVGSTVRYEEVSEYISSDAGGYQSLGKTTHRFAVNTNPILSKMPGESVVFDYHDAWMRGQELARRDFRSYWQGTTKHYEPVQGKGQDYQLSTYTADAVKITRTHKRHNVISDGMPIWFSYENVGVYEYNAVPGFRKVSVIRDTSFREPGTVIQHQEFAYDDSVNVYRESLTRSDGSREITHRLFPYNYGGTAFINNLRTARFLALPIEQVTYREVGSTRTILSGNLTTYRTGGKGLIDQVFQLETLAPVALSAFKFSNYSTGQLPPVNSAGGYSRDTRYQPRLTYDEYDERGNPVQVTETGGPPTSYLWGYNRQYPVAAGRNAGQFDIAYVDFEAAETNLLLTGVTTPLDASAPAGKRVGVLTAPNSRITKYGLSSAKTYVLTYWIKDGTSMPKFPLGTVSAAEHIRTKGTWKCYRHRVSAGTSFMIEPLSGTMRIDDIRIHPLDAQLDTYTYDPLIGMTSHTDGSGNVFYYEYDGFGRLQLIRDLNGHVVEDYRYNYRP